MNYTKFIGLDVHKATVSVGVAYPNSEQNDYLGTIPNTPDALLSLVKRLDDPKKLCFCYEAGPCGYGIYRQLTELGATCIVVAPSLIPTKPGDHIKTDKRDAKKLARLLRNGDLTAVWVPDRHHEALRDLLRMRLDACADLLRKRNQLSKFLLRLGVTPPQKVKAWSVRYHLWLESLRFDEPIHQFMLNQYIYTVNHAKSRVQLIENEINDTLLTLSDQRLFQALQSLKGVGPITAATLIAEIGDISRFRKASQLMAYVGLVPREHSSGNTRWQGKITKAGNAHIRFVTVESSWHYRHNPKVSQELRKRQNNVSEKVKEISWRAQNRLHHKYVMLMVKGKPKQKAIIGVAREMLGFVWEIAQQVARENIAA